MKEDRKAYLSFGHYLMYGEQEKGSCFSSTNREIVFHCPTLE